MDESRAWNAVEKLGIALVYPIANERMPPSLWYELHPRTKMRWDWNEGADDRVVELWHLRNEMAKSGDVAYGKWFRGRATFFALDVFHAMLGALHEAGDVMRGLPRESLEILELLAERSPMSTKELRAAAGLTGKPFEGIFTHAMKALWSRLLVVGVGEVEDGAFPSLAVSATELAFEDIWAARKTPSREQRDKLDAAFARTPAFAKHFAKTLREL
ncbi:MAG TPA: hypothetical protein VIF62_34940 [Labilithrix sp.]|jgi:hypothetical protein